MALADATRSGVEAELREAIRTGRPLDLRTGNAADDDPAHGSGWDAQRTVAAALLVELLASSEGSRRPRALFLAGARIVGQLDLHVTELVCPLLLVGCWFAEPVDLYGVQVPVLGLHACHLPGLSAGGLTTRGNLELTEGFTATGEVNLIGAHIGGQLGLSGATLTNPGGNALAADGLTVDRGMFCDGLTATGEVRLVGAKMGGELIFIGATLTNRNGRALNASRVVADHDIHCSEGFTATGEVNLVGAKIDGTLNLSGATLTKPDGDALNLHDLRAGALFLRNLTKVPELVNFTHAQVGLLVDEPTSWSRQAVLDEFVYDALLEERPVSARQRLGWLARSPRGYVPQPYEQLAVVYRRAGRDSDARTVAIAKQWRRRRTLQPLGKLWNLLLWATVGYGYRMWLAFAWLLGLVVVGWWAFDRAHSAHPAQLVAAKPPGQRPWFHAAVYALDLLLPFVDLGYQGAWIATGSARWLFLGWNLAGWVLTTAVVAAVTGLLKRD